MIICPVSGYWIYYRQPLWHFAKIPNTDLIGLVSRGSVKGIIAHLQLGLWEILYSESSYCNYDHNCNILLILNETYINSYLNTYTALFSFCHRRNCSYELETYHLFKYNLKYHLFYLFCKSIFSEQCRTIPNCQWQSHSTVKSKARISKFSHQTWYITSPYGKCWILSDSFNAYKLY